MKFIEPFNLGKRLDELRQQLQRRQIASHATATEIAFHLRGSPQAAAFETVIAAIQQMDFASAIAAVDALAQGQSVNPAVKPARQDRTPETSFS